MPGDQRIPATIYYCGGQLAHVHSEDDQWIATCEVRGFDEQADDFSEPNPSDDTIRFHVGQCLALDQVPYLQIARVSADDWDKLGQSSPGSS